MNKTILFFALLFSSLYTFGQDSLSNFKGSSLVKGFYKNYKEFLTNAPSIVLDFTTVLIQASKEDSTIVGGEYKLPDSLDNFGEIWGFCDGKNIFVANGTLFTMKYWKLQCKGPNPYFYYLHKDVSVFPSLVGVVSTAITASLPPSCTLMFIDSDGRSQNTFRYKLKHLLRDNPALFKEFKDEDEDLLYDNIIIKYLIRYNNSKLKK